MKYGKGKIRFKGKKNGDYIPKYFSTSIPENLIIHGSTRIKDITTPEIVDFYKEYYIVKYLDKNGKYVQLGFKEDVLEPVPEEYLTEDDLVEGEVYFVWDDEGIEFILNGTGDKKYICTSTKTISSKFYHACEIYKYKKATKQQKEHLEQCIAAGKYVEYEEKEKSWCVQITEENKEVVKSWMSDDIYNFNIGSYYEITKLGNKCGFRGVENFDDNVITTEQFYEKIGHVSEKKDVEKWSVGTWVVKVKEDSYKLKVGDIAICDKDPYEGTAYIEEYLSYDTELDTFKWFATKEEAEEFSRQLLAEQNAPKLELTEEDSEKYELGDWVFILKDSGKLKVGDVGKISELNHGNSFRVETKDLKRQNWTSSDKVRKATKEEIESVTKKEKKDEVKLEKGKWYKFPNLCSGKFLACFTGDVKEKNYGFNSEGEWWHDLGLTEDREYKLFLATDQEVKEALIKEAKKRGFKDKITYKKESGSLVKLISFEDLMFFSNRDGGYLTDGYGGCIFEEGKWATIVEESKETYEENSVAKFKVGDVVNITDRGWQYCDIEYKKAMSYCSSGKNKSGNLSILENKYSKLHNNWWYKLQGRNNWFSECALELTNTVVKKEEKPTDCEPEYVECTKNGSSFTKGKIYKWPCPVDDDNYDRKYITKIDEWTKLFKTSTKEAYDLQESKKLQEELVYQLGTKPKSTPKHEKEQPLKTVKATMVKVDPLF